MIDDALRLIIHIVEKEIGLKPNFVNLSIWEWVVSERMKACQVSSYSDYLSILQSFPFEIKKIIELIVIPETWFFRDKESIDFLVSYVKNIWIHKNIKEPIRILSVPCSTGEEPYSIGMALLDLGLTKFYIKIDAADISSKSIEKAKRGIYGKNSFRANEDAIISKYFDKIGEEIVLHNRVKELVDFHYFNILSNDVPFEPNSYHFIFCKNLLIYLNEKSQNITLELMKKLLMPDGILIVGSAETQLAINAGFIPEQKLKTCVFTHNKNKEFPSDHFWLSKNEIEQLMNEIGQFRDQNEINKGEKLRNVNDKKNDNVKRDLIEKATKMANEGDYTDAIKLCHIYLKKYGINGDVFFLLGLIQHSRGLESEAKLFFQKVIYLSPKHYEALIYLGLLAEKEKDIIQAQRYFERAQKLQNSV